MKTKNMEKPLDVWLRIPAGEDESEAEANTFAEKDSFRVDWYLTSVGLVSSKHFDTYQSSCKWLASQGFEDYSS